MSGSISHGVRQERTPTTDTIGSIIAHTTYIFNGTNELNACRYWIGSFIWFIKYKRVGKDNEIQQQHQQQADRIRWINIMS